jgi:hypothetical protein
MTAATFSRALLILAGAVLLPHSAFGDTNPRAADVLARQAAEYQARGSKSVVELQQFRSSETAAAEDGGGRSGVATLLNLNPRIGAWLLLTLDWGPSGGIATYHLENARPQTQTISLAERGARGIRITAEGRAYTCELWSGGNASALETAKRSGLPYAPLCEGKLYLRNRVSGNQTNLERFTDFLRDHVWGGETVVQLVRREFYRDRFLETGVPGTPYSVPSEAASPDEPRAARLRIAPGERITLPQDLGIELRPSKDALVPGLWYPVNRLTGIYFSFLQPRNIDPAILNSDRNRVNGLDSVEADALDYLVAFDLSRFELGFSLGTDHPRVGWSERVADGMRDPTLKGPDGIDSVAPLVRTGMISPALAAATVATFTGGFKRQHGAFRYGPLSERNHGTHYGFIEQGTVLSKLMPGLSTLYVLDDGSVDMKTWTLDDDALLGRIKAARQNGVALIDYDSATGPSSPGPLVARWGAGNWSGSSDEKLRTLRAGACLQQTTTRRFLIYGYFSSATPSAMARVFQAYGCRYAMHLDMNALEHTYLALYLRTEGEVKVEHLVQGMAQLDKSAGAQVIPRFLGFPDDRDFFYLTEKDHPR